MELSQQWCDNATCRDYGKVGAGNIKVFSHVERRYYCATCRRTFSADQHTFFETLRCPRATVLEALSLLVERNRLRTVARLTHHSRIACSTGSPWRDSMVRRSASRSSAIGTSPKSRAMNSGPLSKK